MDSYDIIVSNPPYVPASEKKSIADNVIKFEPLKALFVDDENALTFHDKIADFAGQKLHTGGKLYLEIHENSGGQAVELLEEKGFSEVTLRKDLNGKDRMISGRK